jgi:hypothetical protein
MRTFIAAAALLAAMVGFAWPAAATDAPLQLKPMPDIAPNVAALPRIVAASDDKAATRINNALDKIDALVRQSVKDCRANVDKADDADYERSVWVTMRGPRYLSFLIGGSADCGGAHPNAGVYMLVYDLATGSPVNWQRLLPKAMVQGTSLDTGMDGATVGFVTSKTLQSLWLKAEAAASPIDPDCQDVLNDPELKLNLWPDPKGGGLGVEPGDLAHVVQACADPMVIPTATLRPLGVDAALLDAIDAAHAGGFFDKDEP